MKNIIRKGIAFNKEELNEFDKIIKQKGYKNRSQALRNLIRSEIIKKQKEDPKKIMMGTLTILYNHHNHNVQHNLTHVQHNHPNLIISSLHVHVNEHDCLEILVLKGVVSKIQQFSENILATNGVKHGKLVFT
jgi:CopG family transcriptional regulator, nickel-responsive regulator